MTHANNGIEQTNGGPRVVMPFAAHPRRWADASVGSAVNEHRANWVVNRGKTAS